MRILVLISYQLQSNPPSIFSCIAYFILISKHQISRITPITHKSKYLWFKKRCFGICVCINQIMRFRHVTINCTLVENFIHKGLCKQDWKWSSILHRFLNIYVAMWRKSIHCPMINQRVLQLFEGFALIWSRDRQEMESSKQKCIINSEVQRFYTI